MLPDIKPATKSGKDSKEFGTGGLSAWITLIVLSLLYVLNYADRQILAVVLEPMKKDLGLTDSQGGMLMSAVLVCMAIFAFPIGALVDRWSRKKSIGLMALIWSAATFFTALGKNFIGVMIPRFLVGLGEAGFAPGGTAIVTASFPATFRSRAMGIFNMCMTLGVAVGAMLGGYLSVHYGGWRTPFYIFAIPGIILGVIAFFLRDYKTVQPAGEGNGFWQNTAQLLKIPTLRWTFIGYGLYLFFSTGVIAWIPTLLIRTMNIAEDKAGMLTGLITIAVVIGTFIGGYLTDLWYRRNIRGRLLVAVISFPATIVFFVAGLFLIGGGQIMAGLICMFIYGFLAVMYMPGITVATQEVVHPRNKGMAWGLAVLIGSIIAAPGPWIIGAVSDAIGGGASGLIYGLLIPPVVGLIGVPFLWRSAVNYPKDRENAQGMVLESE